jgi:hypothetical protein
VIWVLLAAGLALGADWRLVGGLAVALAFPTLCAVAIAAHWWRQRSGISMRSATFCDAVAAEFRAGASSRGAVEAAARSVDAQELVDLCRTGAPMPTIARFARYEFADIGDELEALLARTDGIGVSPAAVFDELGSLALAQVEVAHEVATASAPAVATAAVLLVGPIVAVAITASRAGFDDLLAQPAQRLAALVGSGLVVTGVVVAVLMLRRVR